MRPLPRIKFIWGAGKVIRGRWYFGLFGFYDRVEGEPDSGLAISLRGTLAWGAACGALAYAGAATALHAVWQRNPHNRLTLADALLYPIRRQEVSAKKGQAFIAQGQELFLEKKYQDAAALLRHGLARFPGDPEARITLAQFYALANQRTLAIRTLEEGLAATAYPGRRYMEAIVSAAAAADDHGKILELTGRFLAPKAPAGASADERWLRERRFAALLALGRLEEAVQLGEEARDTALGLEQQVIALLESKRSDRAGALLAQADANPNRDTALVARLRVRVHREAGRLQDMEAALAELRALHPGDPAPLVYAVVQRAMAGQTAEAATALQDYVFRFGGTPENLVLLAEPLAEVRAVDLLARVREAARERGYPPARFQSLLLQAQAMQGDWTGAARTLAEIVVPPREPQAATLWREWMQRLIEVGRAPSDAARLGLVDFLRSRPWPVAIFRQTVDALRSGGGDTAVREVLALAGRVFPDSAWVKDETARLPEANREARSDQLLARKRAVLDAAALGETAFWERVDELLAQREWAEAEEWVRAAWAARPLPDWLARRESDLRLVQVRAATGLGDRFGLMTAARLYLNGDAHRSQHIFVLAEQAAAAGEVENAVVLLREILRRTPEFSDATALLRKVQPPQ